MSNTPNTAIRPDFQIISDWIQTESRVLDLGCGDGTLLKSLHDAKNISGYGLEGNTKNIAKCIDKGVNAIQLNLNDGLPSFENQSFDYVTLSLTLQSIREATVLIDEMLRVGKEAIISFPNFGYWKIRAQLSLGGKMPVSKSLPYEWHDTPNIRLCTINDFQKFCENNGITILEYRALSNKYESTLAQRLFPNLFGNIAMFRISKN